MNSQVAGKVDMNSQVAEKQLKKESEKFRLD